jgi:hypothetical protein
VAAGLEKFENPCFKVIVIRVRIYLRQDALSGGGLVL